MTNYKELVKQRTSIAGYIEEVERFETWWSKNIAKEIVWAKDNNFRRGNYDLFNRNCEHFANMIVYGINYSEQIESSNFASTVDGLDIFNEINSSVAFSVLNFRRVSVRVAKKNNDKGSIIKLINEVREADSLLGWKSDYETEKYERQYLQEVSPKQECRIM